MNLQNLRLKLNKTQKEVAKDLNLSPKTYNNYENKKTEPDIEMLKRMAKYFKTSIDNLVSFETPEKLDLTKLTIIQRNLINKMLKLNKENELRLEAYAEGLLEGQKEHENKIRKILGE